MVRFLKKYAFSIVVIIVICVGFTLLINARFDRIEQKIEDSTMFVADNLDVYFSE